MGKLIKLLLGLTLLLVLAVVVSVVGAILIIDPNDYKDFIITKVEEETGRKLALTGDLSLTYYPWLGLEAEGITLGNARGFGDTPFLHTDLIAVRIKTMPLLKKLYELDTLRLHGLQVNLAKNKEGVGNWEDLTGKQTPEEAEKTSEPLQLAAVILGGVDIKDGLITWHDQNADQKIKISGLNMTTGELSYGEPINLAMGFKAEANKPALQSDLNLKGTLNYDLNAGQYSFKPIDLTAKLTGKNVPGGSADLVFKAAVESNLKEDAAYISDLSLDVLDTSITGALTAGRISSGTPQVKAQLAIKGDDLAKLLQLIDPKTAGELTRLDDRSVDMKLNLEADLEQESVKVTNLDAKLMGAVIQGQVEADNIQSKTPSAKGMLKATGPDLPALLQVIGQFETGTEPKLQEYGKRLAKVADKSFDIGAEFDTDLGSGNIQVPTLTAKTLGITLQGQLAAKDMNSKQGKVDGKFVLQGEKLAEVLAAFDQKALGEVLQKVNIDAGVSGAGGDIVLHPLAVKAIFAGKQIPNSPAEIALNADTQVNLEKQTLAMNNMTLQGLGMNVSGNINGSKILTKTPVVNGKIDAKGNDLALLFKVAGIEPLAGQLAGLQDRSFDIKTSLDADLEKSNIKVSNLNAQLLGATINGQIDASNIQSKTPSAKGKLKASGPDLPALLQVAGQFEGGEEPKFKGLGKQLSKVSDKTFDVSADFDADLEKGNIKVSDLDAQLLGASIKGQMDASQIQSKTPAFKGKLNASGTDLPALLQIAGQFQGGEKPKLKEFADQLAKVSDKTFNVSADFDADLKSGNITVSTLAAKALGFSANGHLTAIDINSNKGSIDGKLSIGGEQLSGVLTAFGQGSLGEVLQKISVDAGINGSRSDITLSPLEVKATLAGKQIPNSPVDATLRANTRANLEQQTLTVSNLAVTGLGLNVLSNINATQILEKPGFTGDLTVAEFNLRKLAQQLNQTLPETADKNVLSKVALKTGFSGNTDNLSLKNLALQLDDTKLNGNLAVAHFTQPDIQFGIGIDSINADRYLPPPAKDKPAKPVTPETAVGAATELPLETLRTLKINGDLQIGQLVLSNARLNNVKVSILARDGDIRLNPVTADLYEGKYQGVIALDAKGKLPQLQLSSQLHGVQLEPLIKDYTQQPESQLAGIADLSATQLSTTGGNVIELKQALTGQGQFSVKQGVLRGIDVRKTLEQAEILLEGKQFGQVKQGGETLFDQLTGTLDINSGIVKNKDLLMTSPGFKVTGNGVLANLHNDTIKYDMEVAVIETTETRGVERYNVGGYKIPIRCQGKLNAIASACQPDYGELAKAAIKKTIEKDVKKKIGESLGIEIPGVTTTEESVPQQPATPQEPQQQEVTPTQETQQEEAAPTQETKKKKKKKDPVEQLQEDIEGLGEALGL
ncbi:MAG: AsmA family protein [Gammaproteobacteria bacterium]|nr:AsmA family protein [Gammaproteobacteria bacterium]